MKKKICEPSSIHLHIEHLLLQILLSPLSTASVISTPAAASLRGPHEESWTLPVAAAVLKDVSASETEKKSTFLSVWLFMLLWKLYSIYIYLYIYIYKKKGKQTKNLITSTTWKMGDFKSGFRRRVYKSLLIYHYINFGLHYAFI